ncbi:MAG: hypothetical protein GC180_06775 [Bacteroidetes bacterium]|nr:hypothetical protein [Bacteroidota bacterium]
MNTTAFDPSSRLWLYTSSRNFSDAECKEIKSLLAEFAAGWTAHDKKLKATGSIEHGRVVALMVDESQAGASGCSIDKSVHFLRDLGVKYDTDFFVRNLVGVKMNGTWEWVDFRSIPTLLQEGKISSDTMVLDNTIQTAGSLNRWEKRLSDTWLNRYL